MVSWDRHPDAEPYLVCFEVGLVDEGLLQKSSQALFVGIGSIPERLVPRYKRIIILALTARGANFKTYLSG